jgi:CRISPR/Cas system-associated exonuclease Cas4 (RecB family)
MIYSYTQISQYLGCPRRYRYRYLDGWRESENRAAMLFGRAFEKALAAFFCRQDAAATLYQEWAVYRKQALDYSHGDDWDRLWMQGVQLLNLFAQQNRIQIPRPQLDQQVKLERQLASGNSFVGYIDAIGLMNGERVLIEWKTTSSRYAEQPEGLMQLDPQAICYSWMSGISKVVFVVFVRKRLPEIQYLECSITEDQRAEFGNLVNSTTARIEAGEFPSHSGIRFPQNGCVSCPYMGLCLENQELISAKLTRQPGADQLDWIDQLE